MNETVGFSGLTSFSFSIGKFRNGSLCVIFKCSSTSAFGYCNLPDRLAPKSFDTAWWGLVANCALRLARSFLRLPCLSALLKDLSWFRRISRNSDRAGFSNSAAFLYLFLSLFKSLRSSLIFFSLYD